MISKETYTQKGRDFNPFKSKRREYSASVCILAVIVSTATSRSINAGSNINNFFWFFARQKVQIIGYMVYLSVFLCLYFSLCFCSCLMFF
jgi:hypothetical protein